MSNETLREQLIAAFGTAPIAETPPFPLPDRWETPPVLTLMPGSADEIVQAVQIAEAEGVAILPIGSGTQLQAGYPPRPDKPYLLLSLTRLNRILDYQPDDLTVTCEPGVTLAALQQSLAERRQFLALDAPLPERATLGGIVATCTSGFWRPAYGAPRDLVIGLRAIMTDGVSVKGGGKVVKNVAGYDVCKLFTGAWGTLGVLTEITFKIRTRPDTERALAWDAPDIATAARIGLILHHARLAGTYFLATSESDHRPRLIIGLQGTSARVEWQAQEYTRLAAEAGLTAEPIPLSEADVSALRDRQARLDAETPLAGRLACLPTELPTVVQALEALSGLALTAHCATGVLSFALAKPEPAAVTQILRTLPPKANLVWTRMDRRVPDQASLALWGEPREDFVLHRALKQALDPKNTFSPGRFYGKL